jgi:hypothetical protein
MKPGDKTMKKLLNLQPPADIEIKETSTRDIAIIGIDVVFFAVVGWVFFNERIVYT